MPDMDYASTCWDLASDSSLKPLKTLYHRSLKLILLKSSSLEKKDYKNLDILPFDMKCLFNKAVFMYKIINKLTPSYLLAKFQYIDVRNKQVIYIRRPRTNLFMTSLSYSGAKLWNELSQTLKSKTTLVAFKKAYYAHLMAQV